MALNDSALLAAPSYSFTRPADTTTYAVGDLVANSTTAGSVVPMSWVPFSQRPGFYVTGVRLKLDKALVTNAQFRVHLYKATPTFVTGGDNSAFGTVVATGYSNWIGSFDTTIVALHADGVAGIAVPTDGVIVPQILVAGSTVYGLVEALAAYAPKSAGTITAELLVEGN